ncbi:MAG: peptide deformylase [bacterium]|nr:peptide deformylase [bacterium]
MEIENKILNVSDKKDNKVLRKKTKPFDLKDFKSEEIKKLVADMRRIMRAANGIGLAANQIGLPWRVFVAEVPSGDGGTKFYAMFNPTLEKTSEEHVFFEEGCLSVPGVYGEVERPERVTLNAFDAKGKPVKIKAWGLLARVFQHEMDHLNGYVFIDRTKQVYKAKPNP